MAAVVKDMLGRPCVEGDHIVYSAPAGTGSSQLRHAEIVKLIPIIPHPNGEPKFFIREDQLSKSRPTRFWAPGYAVQVHHLMRRSPDEPLIRDSYPRRTVTSDFVWVARA